MARGASSVKSQNPLRGFVTVLASAALEWVLMSMLFFNAFFSYLITKFALYYELPIPCLLCSRLDNKFGGDDRAGFYWDLICGNHKSEISSLVLCNHHDKLVDVHEMCESCLFSFATAHKSNAETYRLLVGKLGAESDADFDDEDPLCGDQKPSIRRQKRCACCNEEWTSRMGSDTETFFKTESREFEAADLDAPLLRDLRQDSSHLKKDMKTSILSAASLVKEGSVDNTLVHFAYKELKVHSDSESEFQTSDNEDSRALVCETSEPQENEAEESLLMEPQVTMAVNYPISEKPINPDASVPEPAELLPWKQSQIIEPHDGPSSSSTHDIGHGLEELDWQQIDHNVKSSPSDDINNIHDAPGLAGAGQFSVDPSNHSCNAESEENKAAAQPGVDVSSTLHETETITNTTVTGPKTSVDLNDTDSQNTNYMDLVDAYKLVVSSRGRQLPGKLMGQQTGKDSTNVSEDLKILLSQLSAARGLEVSLNDSPSPRPPVNLERLKSDTSTSIGMQILQSRASLERNDSRRSLERNESSLESLDFSTVSEIEGESDIDRLKRQLEQDKKLITSLCRELDEERNASAISANQAMAMITRLQEEKAALQMNALQDLRMMEEEAEYDMEALQKANDLLSEREKELQDLEAELEYYRVKYPDESWAVNNTVDTDSGKPSKPYDNYVSFGEHKEDVIMNSIESEDEKLYIAHCLGQLEKKLYRYSSNGSGIDMANGECLGKEMVEKDETARHKDGFQSKNEVEENVSTPRSRSHAFIRRVQSYKTLKCFGPGSIIHKEADIVAFGNEVSNLNERLQALEADRTFLQNAIHSLRNGDDALNLIREIASDLRELRKAGIRRKQVLS